MKCKAVLQTASSTNHLKNGSYVWQTGNAKQFAKPPPVQTFPHIFHMCQTGNAKQFAKPAPLQTFYSMVHMCIKQEM